MRTIITYSVWAAAFALVNGVRLVDTVPGDRVGFVLDDSDGRATWAVIQWRQDDATVDGRALVETYRDLLTRARSERIA